MKYARSGISAALIWQALVVSGLLVTSVAMAAEKVAPSPAASAPAAATGGADSTGAEEVQVEQIKKKYWAGGDEAQVGVVQNRAYSKAHKFSIGLSGGLMFNDPFVDSKPLGGAFGYHFSEYFGAELLFWKISSKGSSANSKLEESGKKANTNPPSSFIGADVMWSIMYGKLSFLGRKIIYYDMHLLAGGGLTTTETGKYATGIVGLGQRFYMNQSISLRFDYRLVGYHENIIEKEVVARRGQPAGSRMNFGHTLLLGVDFMFGGGKK